MTLVAWPNGLTPSTIVPQLVGQSRSMQKSLSGFTQVSAAVDTRWMLTLEFNTLKREHIRWFRGWVASMEGMLNTCRVPIWDKRLEPSFLSGSLSGTYSAGTTHSDGTSFSDGSLYVIDGTLSDAVNASIGTKSFTVDLSTWNEEFTVGHYFGIDNDVYICKSISYDGAGVATIGHEPALRRTYVNGDFKLRPYLHCRFTSDTIGRLPLYLGLRGAPVLDFEEVPE